MTKGVLLAGGSGSRLWPVTLAISKQLAPIYDKPMVYYPLCTLMLAGARDIAIIVTPETKDAFFNLLGDGEKFGLSFCYLEQKEPRGLADAYILAEDFINHSSSVMVLGDNLFHGEGLGSRLSTAFVGEGASIFGYRVANPEEYGVVEFTSEGRVLGITEKPSAPKSDVAVPGLYFLDGSAPVRAKELSPSRRGELEITNLLESYLKEDLLRVSLLPRSTVWLDTGNAEAMAEATDYVRVIQRRQGRLVGSPEEVAWRLGLIDDTQLQRLASNLSKSDYGKRLQTLLDGPHDN